MVRLDKISYLITNFKPFYKEQEQYQYSIPPLQYNFDNAIYTFLKRIGIFPKSVSNLLIDKTFLPLIPYGREEYLLINIKKHCEIICLNEKPKCVNCDISLHCDFFNKKNDWNKEV